MKHRVSFPHIGWTPLTDTTDKETNERTDGQETLETRLFVRPFNRSFVRPFIFDTVDGRNDIDTA